VEEEKVRWTRDKKDGKLVLIILPGSDSVNCNVDTESEYVGS